MQLHNTNRRNRRLYAGCAGIIGAFALILGSLGHPERLVGMSGVPAVQDTVSVESTVPRNVDTTPEPPAQKEGRLLETGEASYYGPGFAGRLTASGERFDPNAMTAAHPTLPFGTELRVVNRATGRSVVVRVNDRGPYAGNRIIDLSRGAASRIGMIQSGTASVRVEVLS